MKKSVKAFITALSTIVIFTASTALIAEQPKRHGWQQIAAQLNLSEEQKQAIKPLMPYLRMGGKRFALGSFSSVIKSDTLDQRLLDLTIDATLANAKIQGLNSASKRYELSQILTQAQQDQLVVLLQNAMARRSEQTQRFDKMVDKLSLTEEQVTTLQPTFDELVSLRENAQTLKQEFMEFEQGLIQVDNFDKDKWLAYFESVAPTMRSNHMAMATHFHTIYQALDNNQKAKLNRMMRRKMGKEGRRHSA